MPTTICYDPTKLGSFRNWDPSKIGNYTKLNAFIQNEKKIVVSDGFNNIQFINNVKKHEKATKVIIDNFIELDEQDFKDFQKGGL